jgi:predicted permease
MADWRTILLIIATMFLVILVGWLARRYRYLTAETTATLSTFVVDITIPALIFTQMLRTIDPVQLHANWYVPLLGGGILLVSLLVALAAAPLLSARDLRPTFLFLVMIANWVYLPLPIAQALYGADGTRTVLLTNVGSQLVLWSLGVWTLRGGKPDPASLKNLVTNPGLIATVVGIVVAVFFPGVKAWLLAADGKNPLYYAPFLLGELTIPLSLIVTGAQLGGLDLSDHRPSKTLTGVIVTRLLLAPLVAIVLIALLSRAGLPLPTVPRMVTYIIAAMPVAISCSIFTERFGGDTPLAARSIFLTTLFSIATVPAIIFLIQRLGL